MPFNIVKYKRGWRVQDDKGNFYSKKALTKKNARQQQKALYASESRRELLTGTGFVSYLDGEGNYRILLQGDGFFGDIFAKIKSVGNRVIQTLLPPVISPILATASQVLSTGVREDYPPDARQTLAKYGNGQVYDLMIIREPIKSFINTALNAITLGKWNEAREKLNYDKLFHLSMIASVAMPNGDKARIKIEKNEVINITDKFSLKVPGVSSGVSSNVSQHGSGEDAEVINVPVPCCISLSEMMMKAQQAKGPAFFKYDAFNNNCQMFIISILDANDLTTPSVRTFVSQSTEQLLQELPSYTKPFASVITNIAGLANRFMYGRGEGMCCDECCCMEAKGMRGGKIYCGMKEPPAGVERGTTLKCFKKGVGVGMMLEKQKAPAEKALTEMTIRELGQVASKQKVKGYAKMKKQELIDAITQLRGGALEAPTELQADGSWKGDLVSWQNAGFPGCGPNSYYNTNSECFDNCYENEEQFACISNKEQRDRDRGDITRLSNNATVRTAIQDGDSMRRYFAIEIRKGDEDLAKTISSDSGIPPVPEWKDIPEGPVGGNPPPNYTGFYKYGTYNEDTKVGNFSITYYRNGNVVRTGLVPGKVYKNNFDWNKIEERWNRLQRVDLSRPGQFNSKRKDGSDITFDKDGREKFDVLRHGSVEWLNSVEGRHIREADPYFEELYQRLKETEHSYAGRSEEEIKKREEALEKQYQDEVDRRYGSNVDILSPEAGFTLTDKNGNKQRVNKVRLRKDGGYDIQYANGLYEYQKGEDEWDCNEWKKGDRIEDYGVCGTEGRKQASQRVKQNIDRERDQQWDGMSGWDKFKNGLAVAGSVTMDYVLPIASTILSFVPGIGQVASTALDVAGMVAGKLTEGECRHFNECTAQQKAVAEANSLYHRTAGDTVAEQYLGDENWQKLLEANEKVYGLVGDTAKYGSRAGKFYETGAGKPTLQISPTFKRQLKKEGLTPEKYLEVVRDIANEEGYDGRAIEFSDDPEKKLMIYDDEGNKRYFGQVGYNDFIIWSKQEALGKVRKGFAEMKRRVFNKSHSKIKGDWRSDKFSPNNLAMKILW